MSLAFDVRLVGSRPLTHQVRELRFERVDGAPFDYKPGQWLNLVLPLATGAEPVTRRSYSIASAPTGSSGFEIAVTRVANGAGSEYLHALREDETLGAIGPYGIFTRDAADAAPAIFVATGTGVTPMRAMLQAAVRAGSKAKFALLFGARTEADVLYRDEFEAAREAGVLVRYAVTLSQPTGSWRGLTGYVQTHLPTLHAEFKAQVAPAEPHIFICGLDRMVSTVRELSRGDLGLGRKQVHVERYD